MKNAPSTLDPNIEVYQHNNLIRTSLRMGEMEAQIFVRALACIHQSKNPDEPLPPIQIRISDLVSTTNTQTYEQIRQACKDLFDQELHLVSVRSKRKNADYWSRLVTDIGLNEGTGLITGYFNPRIQPFLQGLIKAAGGEGEFTYAYLTEVLTLRNPHAQRMYWLLKSWQGKGVIQYTIEELKFFLFEVGAVDRSGKPKEAKDPYPIWADFARFVLKPVEKELTKIDFPVEMIPVKTGKKTTAVKFILPPKSDKPKAVQTAIAFAQPAAPAESKATAVADGLPPMFGKVFGALVTIWHLSPTQLEALKAAVGANETKLDKLRAVMSAVNAEKATIDNIPAVLWTRLKKEFPSLAAGK